MNVYFYVVLIDYTWVKKKLMKYLDLEYLELRQFG